MDHISHHHRIHVWNNSQACSLHRSIDTIPICSDWFHWASHLSPHGFPNRMVRTHPWLARGFQENTRDKQYTMHSARKERNTRQDQVRRPLCETQRIQRIGKETPLHVFGYHPVIVYKKSPPKMPHKQTQGKGFDLQSGNGKNASDLPISWAALMRGLFRLVFLLEAFVDALFSSAGAPPLDPEHVAEQGSLAGSAVSSLSGAS